jgi:hypothetical protein
MNNDDESVIETKVHKVSETLSNVKTSRKCLNRKINKKDLKYQNSYIKFRFTSMLNKVNQNVLFV